MNRPLFINCPRCGSICLDALPCAMCREPDKKPVPRPLSLLIRNWPQDFHRAARHVAMHGDITLEALILGPRDNRNTGPRLALYGIAHELGYSPQQIANLIECGRSNVHKGIQKLAEIESSHDKDPHWTRIRDIARKTRENLSLIY